MSQRRAGIIYLKLQGEIHYAKGNFSYNLGREKRESIVGADRIHGYKAMPQAAFIEGEVTDHGTLDLERLVTGEDLTITLEHANGKTILLREAFFAGEGTANTEEANIAVRWERSSVEEVR